MKANLICAVLAASAAGTQLEKTRGQWLADNNPNGYAHPQTYPNVIGAPVHVPEQPYLPEPVPDVYVEDVHVEALPPVYVPVEVTEPVVHYEEPVTVEEPVAEEEYNYFSLGAVERSEQAEPTVTVVPAYIDVVVDDVEKVVANNPEPVVYVAPTEEPSDYVEVEEPAEPEVVYQPEPPTLPPPQAPEAPSSSPSWLNSWMTELAVTVTPDLPKVTVQKAEVPEKPTYGIQKAYTRKWGKSAYTKPAVSTYSTPTYKPVKYTPKSYTPKAVTYSRPEPKVEVVEKEEEAKPVREKKSYSGYDSDDKKYLRTYHNRYSGTPTKSHSHMSCLQRMLARFSKFNSIVRANRQARSAKLSSRRY